jgi:predicted transcriptional regulator
VAIDYKPISEANRRARVLAGLSEDQAVLYESLIHYGPQKATRLAFLAGVPRTLSYRHLEELIEQGLVAKEEQSGKVARFAPAHPLKLKDLATQRLEDAQAAKGLVEEVLPALVRNFDTMLGTLPQASLYKEVAQYAARASLGPLSRQEQEHFETILKDLAANLPK